VTSRDVVVFVVCVQRRVLAEFFDFSRFLHGNIQTHLRNSNHKLGLSVYEL